LKSSRALRNISWWSRVMSQAIPKKVQQAWLKGQLKKGGQCLPLRAQHIIHNGKNPDAFSFCAAWIWYLIYLWEEAKRRRDAWVGPWIATSTWKE
jgi:hypothetical protein